MVTFRCRVTYHQWFCAAEIVNSLSKLTSIAPGVCIYKLSITDCQAALRVEEVKNKNGGGVAETASLTNHAQTACTLGIG